MNSHHHYTPACHTGFWILWLLLLIPVLLAGLFAGWSSLATWQANFTLMEGTSPWVMLIPAGLIVMLEVMGALVLQWVYWRRVASPLTLCISTAGIVVFAVVALPIVGIMSGF